MKIALLVLAYPATFLALLWIDDALIRRRRRKNSKEML